jgi:hypothetical protein
MLLLFFPPLSKNTKEKTNPYPLVLSPPIDKEEIKWGQLGTFYLLHEETKFEYYNNKSSFTHAPYHYN